MPIHPHEVRVAARNAAYPNSRTERETIERVDREVFDRVRPFEHEMVRNAREWMGEADVHDQAASALEDAMRDEVRRAADRSDAQIDKDLATRYRGLSRDAEAAIQQLEAQARHAEFNAARLEDPYAEWCRLVGKYPQVMPTVSL